MVGQFNAIEYVTLRYSIKVTGTTSAGGSATVHETGILATILTLEADGKSSRNFKFSGFGAFFDNGDTQANAPLANGTFSGPVHTNTHFAFLSNRSVTFRNVVSQVDAKIRYDDTSTTTPKQNLPPPNLTGITISTEGYKTTGTVPLPDNNFSQEYAVINSTGITEKKSDGTPVDPPRSWVNDSTALSQYRLTGMAILFQFLTLWAALILISLPQTCAMRKINRQARAEMIWPMAYTFRQTILLSGAQEYTWRVT